MSKPEKPRVGVVDVASQRVGPNDRLPTRTDRVLEKFNPHIPLDQLFLGSLPEGTYETVAGVGFESIRVGVEMSMVCDKNGNVMEEGLDKVKGDIARIRQAGLKPIVCLHHFAEPGFIDWRNPESVDIFCKYAEAVVREIGSDVKQWLVFNEVNTYWGLYLLHPEFRAKGTGLRHFFTGILNMRRAHQRVYKMIHEVYKEHQGAEDEKDNWPLPEVSSSVQFITARAKGKTEPATAGLAGAYNVVTIGIAYQLMKRLDMDYLAFQYYISPVVVDLKNLRHVIPAFPNNPIGFDPEAFIATLKHAARLFPDKPIRITEIGWHGERQKDNVILALTHLLEAMESDPDLAARVQEILLFALVDGPEWSIREAFNFGLFEIKNGRLVPRKAAQALSRILKPEMIPNS